MNYLDLFSGIGGFALGFRRAGWTFDNHYFSEIDKNAISVYKRHFPEAVGLGSITGIKPEELGNIDVITFGFPCQDLSIAGKRKGLGGSRSGLFFEACRLIGGLKPSIIVFENVKGLLSADNGTAVDVCLDSLTELGYIMDIGLMNTAWYLPQNRERIYGVGGSWLWILQGLIKSGMTEKSVFSKSIIEGCLLRELLNILDEAKRQRGIGSITLDLPWVARSLFQLNGKKTKSKFSSIIRLWEYADLKTFCQDIPLTLSKSSDINSKHSLSEFQQEIAVAIKSDTNDTREDEGLFFCIERLLSNLSDDDLSLMSKCIISTWIKIITRKKTFTFAEIDGITQSYILTLSKYSPDYLNEVLSDLIKRLENISYAENPRVPTEGDETYLFDEFPISRGTIIGYETLGHLGERGGRKVFPIGEGNRLSSQGVGEGQIENRNSTAITQNYSKGVHSGGETYVLDKTTKQPEAQQR